LFLILFECSIFLFKSEVSMSILDQLNNDLKDAMRAKDQVKMQTLRSLKTVLKTDASEAALSEADEINRLSKAAKQRRDSAAMFDEGGRTELAEKERQELAIIESYLPKQLSEQEVETIVKETIASVGASSAKDTGLVMRDLMPKLKGKADGKLIQEITKRLLS
jgi:hypothetical protein